MILARHGQSLFNVHYARTRCDPGIPDPALTEEGRRQAEALAETLRRQGVRRLIASPYTRALETASIIATMGSSFTTPGSRPAPTAPLLTISPFLGS